MRVLQPCPRRFADLAPTRRDDVRHCDHCGHDVVFIGRETPQQALERGHDVICAAFVDDAGRDVLGKVVELPSPPLLPHDDHDVWATAARAAQAHDWQRVRRALLTLERTPTAVVRALGRVENGMAVDVIGPALDRCEHLALAFVRGDDVAALRAHVDGREDALRPLLAGTSRWAIFEVALAMLAVDEGD